MNSQEFVKMVTEYFGDWKNPGTGLSVKVWAKNKSNEYLSAMWPLIRDRRDASFGPPSIANLLELHDDACNKMRLNQKPSWEEMKNTKQLPGPGATISQAAIDTWSTDEDGPGDRWLSREATHEALGIIMGRLRERMES